MNRVKTSVHRRELLIQTPGELESALPELSARLSAAARVLEEYPLTVSRYYLALADPENPDDPILAQCLPSPAEARPGGSEDPLDEEGHSPLPVLVRRYPDRALLLVTGSCFVHCRHCNRKRLWRRGRTAISDDDLSGAVDFLREEKGIREVIISGGDPLTLRDERLEEILMVLRTVPHLEVIRIGTRAPVVLPGRIGTGLTDIIERYGPIWVNTQFNHPREVTPEAGEACLKLLRAGAPVGNQSVLLKGVNDRIEVMMELGRALERIRVRPYYLFQCEPVRGAVHFRTPLSVGLGIIDGMRGRVGGQCIPTFVVDTPGAGGKVPLLGEGIISREGSTVYLRDPRGGVIPYRDPEPEEY